MYILAKMDIVVNTISATELKNKVSEVLNEVAFKGNIAVIERYGKPIAKIVPAGNLDKVLGKYFGALPDFPDVTKFRRSRKKKLVLSL